MSFLDLNSTSEVNEFIRRNLQPDETFSTEYGQHMDLLATFLREKSHFTVAENLKGGSLGKGTAVKDKTDLDVILFSPKYQDLKHFRSCLDTDLDELVAQIKIWNCKDPNKVQYIGRTAHAVKLKIRANDGYRWADVDLLPALKMIKKEDFAKIKEDLPGECSTQQEGGKAKNKASKSKNPKPKTRKVKQKPKPPKMKVFSKIDAKDTEYASVCLAPLQIIFVKKQRPNVKDLIRLVKHWKQSIDFQGMSKKEKKIPTSYVFELLTIHAWEKAGRPDRFDTTKGFMAVLKILKDYGHINASWDEYYDKDDYEGSPKKMPHRPFILDPANPFNNVCARFDGWHLVSEAAHSTIHCNLFQDVKLKRKRVDTHSYDWE